jgi:hypothetical protein
VVVAEPVDRHGAQGDTGFERDGHTLIDLAEFLQRQAEGEVVATHAAVLLGERQTEQAHVGHSRDDFVREGVLFVVLGGHGCHHALGEVSHRLRKLLIVIRQHAGG